MTLPTNSVQIFHAELNFRLLGLSPRIGFSESSVRDAEAKGLASGIGIWVLIFKTGKMGVD